MKRISFIALIILLFAFFRIPAFSQEMRIAIMDLKADGVQDRTARTVSNMLRTEFVNIGRFMVVERTQMNEILKEQGLQKTGCTDQACAVQLGRLMSAKKMLVGEVSPMGKSIILTVRIVDVEKGVSDFAATEKAMSEEVLDDAVKNIAQKLVARIEQDKGAIAKLEEPKKEPKKEQKPEKVEPSVITPTGYYLRGIIPGWGQWYAGSPVKGGIYFGIFAAATTFFILSNNGYNNDKKTYDNLPTGTPQNQFDDAYNQMKSSSTLAVIGLSLFIASYVANWVDLVFFTSPSYGTRTGGLSYGNSFLTIDTFRTQERSPEQITSVKIGMRF
jgi:TolB-like protein